MGQYYRPILGDSYGLNCKVFNRTVDGEYTFAKLLEHSWWKNPFVNAFSEKLYEEPGRVKRAITSTKQFKRSWISLKITLKN